MKNLFKIVFEGIASKMINKMKLTFICMCRFKSHHTNNSNNHGDPDLRMASFTSSLFEEGRGKTRGSAEARQQTQIFHGQCYSALKSKQEHPSLSWACTQSGPKRKWLQPAWGVRWVQIPATPTLVSLGSEKQDNNKKKSKYW